MRRLLSGAAVLLGILACSGNDQGRATDSEYGGTLVIATGADFGPLFPSNLQYVHENALVDIVFERLAEPGQELNSVGEAKFSIGAQSPRIARWASRTISLRFSASSSCACSSMRAVTSGLS